MSNDLEPIVVILILLSCSVGLRKMLIIADQNWIRTYAHTLTVVLLPIITYAITVVIAGNIALSLGMVGALSIVRFRNPVKSPFELVVFFLLITMGITAGANIEVLLSLTLVSGTVLLGFKAVDMGFKKIFNKNFFQVSFSEGSELPTVEINSSEKLIGLLESEQLISFSMQGEQYSYVLASRDKSDLLQLVDALEGNLHVQGVRFSTY